MVAWATLKLMEESIHHTFTKKKKKDWSPQENIWFVLNALGENSHPLSIIHENTIKRQMYICCWMNGDLMVLRNTIKL